MPPLHRPSDDYLQSLLTVPAKESSFLRMLASEIFKDKKTTNEKVLAVQDHFQSNFSYSLTAQPDRNLFRSLAHRGVSQ